MQQENRSPQSNANVANQSDASNRAAPVQATTFALRSLGQVVDMNLAATRVLLQTQARAASAFGWPDMSEVFSRVDERARNVFAAGAQQLAQTAQITNEAASDLQRQVGRVVETQAATVAQSLQQGLEELGTQTSEGLKQLCETAREQAENAERLGESLNQEMRETLRHGGEQMRDAMRQSGEQMRDAAQQASGEAHDAMGRGQEVVGQGDDKSRRAKGHPVTA